MNRTSPENTDTVPENTDTGKPGNTLRTTIRVEGMTCASCTGRATKALTASDGVLDAQVNLMSGEATVLHTDSVDEDYLRSLVENAGFSSPPTTDELRTSKPLKTTATSTISSPKPATPTPATPTPATPTPALPKTHDEQHDHRTTTGHELLKTTTPPETHDQIELKRIGQLYRRLILSTIFGVPVMVISMLPPLHFHGWRWVAMFSTAFVMFVPGRHFHQKAARNLRYRLATMETLISLGTLSAFMWSLIVLITTVSDTGSTDTSSTGTHVYFETAVVIIILVLLGKWLEARAVHHSGDAIRNLARLKASTAVLVDGREIPVEDLDIGMRFLVRPGERIATDGIVAAGTSSIDTSIVTGESIPVKVAVGDEVIGATINIDGVLEVETTKTGEDTVLSQIMRLVKEAQSGRASVQRLADRVAQVFVPTVMAISAVTLAVWFAIGASASEGFAAAVAVLIISCPCALGLATPLAVMVGTGRGAQLGVIIKGAEVLEQARDIDTAILDKTGTVTEGRLKVVDYTTTHDNTTQTSTQYHKTPTRGQDATAQEHDTRTLIRLAAALSSRSKHPVDIAVADKWPTELVVATFDSKPGEGIVGTVDDIEVRYGRSSLFDNVPEALEQAAEEARSAGRTIAFVGRGDTAEMVISLADMIKSTSRKAVQALQKRGIEVMLLSGDSHAVASSVASAVGIESSEVIAEVLPHEKSEVVTRLQKDERRVAMVGDGINDAPALAQADLGIALSTGADIAAESADIILIGGDLNTAVDAIALSRQTLTTIKTNLFWAFAYNVAAIPLAATGVLGPMPAAAAMVLSSLFVVGNSLRLRGFNS